MKIKKDISIVQEFLGTTDVIELITPIKCCRCYSKKPQNSPCDVVVILTPMLSEDNEVIDKIKHLVSKYGSFTCVEHERKGNKVYTFEMVGG
jgi:hypothetical protein